MVRGSKYSKHNNTQRVTSRSELMQAKMVLVAARERKEPGAFVGILNSYPAYVPELAEFNAALVATSGYQRERRRVLQSALWLEPWRLCSPLRRICRLRGPFVE